MFLTIYARKKHFFYLLARDFYKKVEIKSKSAD